MGLEPTTYGLQILNHDVAGLEQSQLSTLSHEIRPLGVALYRLV